MNIYEPRSLQDSIVLHVSANAKQIWQNESFTNIKIISTKFQTCKNYVKKKHNLDLLKETLLF